jgi:hypothetical protein
MPLGENRLQHRQSAQPGKVDTRHARNGLLHRRFDVEIAAGIDCICADEIF